MGGSVGRWVSGRWSVGRWSVSRWSVDLIKAHFLATIFSKMFIENGDWVLALKKFMELTCNLAALRQQFVLFQYILFFSISWKRLSRVYFKSN